MKQQASTEFKCEIPVLAYVRFYYVISTDGKTHANFKQNQVFRNSVNMIMNLKEHIPLKKKI